MIRIQDLEFRPIDPPLPEIMNVKVPVSEHFRLTISYSLPHAAFAVGDHEQGFYEVAVQACETPDGPGDLVYIDGRTTQHHLDEVGINQLFERAKLLQYAGRIDVPKDGLPHHAGQDLSDSKHWHPRFFCAHGEDVQTKAKYADKIWPMQYRFIPVGSPLT
jgi:hypothetical protein